MDSETPIVSANHRIFLERGIPRQRTPALAALAEWSASAVVARDKEGILAGS